MGAELDGVVDVASHSTLYAIGAYFCDQHPEHVEDVLADAGAIESAGLRAWADREGLPVQDAFETLVTGLSIRFYTAMAGEPLRPGGGAATTSVA